MALRAFRISSLCICPLIGRNRGINRIMVGFNSATEPITALHLKVHSEIQGCNWLSKEMKTKSNQYIIFRDFEWLYAILYCSIRNFVENIFNINQLYETIRRSPNSISVFLRKKKTYPITIMWFFPNQQNF